MQKGLSLVTHNGVTIAELYGAKVAVIDMNTKKAMFDTHGWSTRSTVKAINSALEKAGLHGRCARHADKLTLYIGAHQWPHVDGLEIDLAEAI